MSCSLFRVCSPPLLFIFCLLTLGSCSDSGTGPVPRQFVDFTVESIDPYAAAPGTKVTLLGYGFGRDTNNIRITVGGVVADSIVWLRPDRVEFIMPERAAGGGLFVERFGDGEGYGILYPFRVIRSPYGYNAFSVSLSGVMGKRIWEQSRRNEAGRGGTDTSKVEFQYSGRVGTSEDGMCRETTSGDTIRLCTHSKSGPLAPEDRLFYHREERGTLHAVVDSARKLLRNVRIDHLSANTSQVWTMQSRMTRMGTILLLGDLPYHIDSDGDIVVALEGSALREKVIGYEYSFQDNQQEPDFWSSASHEIGELVEFPDEASLRIRLYHQR